jgi:hypothetical protein
MGVSTFDDMMIHDLVLRRLMIPNTLALFSFSHFALHGMHSKECHYDWMDYETGFDERRMDG